MLISRIDDFIEIIPIKMIEELIIEYLSQFRLVFGFRFHFAYPYLFLLVIFVINFRFTLIFAFFDLLEG